MPFFGGISIGRVGTPEDTPDGVLKVASLLDLAATKAKVILQRAESKDYLDILAILESGMKLSQAMAAACALYGEQYNPILTLKYFDPVRALTYFGDGDLFNLTNAQRKHLIQVASEQKFELPTIDRLSEELSGA